MDRLLWDAHTHSSVTLILRLLRPDLPNYGNPVSPPALLNYATVSLLLTLAFRTIMMPTHTMIPFLGTDGTLSPSIGHFTAGIIWVSLGKMPNEPLSVLEDRKIPSGEDTSPPTSILGCECKDDHRVRLAVMLLFKWYVAWLEDDRHAGMFMAR